MRRLLSVFLLAAFAVNSVITPLHAQQLSFPQPNSIPVLQGVEIDPDNAFSFRLIINRGTEMLTETEKKTEYRKLVEYFLASLTVPDKNQWVNLSPYEHGRMINEDFGRTSMGQHLLAQDYVLKQLTASLLHPDQDVGAAFWERVYREAREKFGTSDIPTDSFNKVWIVPQAAEVVESGRTAFIAHSSLKVLLEADYVARSASAKTDEEETPQQALARRVMAEVVIPALEREVNQGKSFANLRQIYSGMILATWYKKALKQSLLGKHYADRSRVAGIDQDPAANEQIYEEYVEAFRKGVFDFIREESTADGEGLTARRYFSGGFSKQGLDHAMRVTTGSLQDLPASVLDVADIGLREVPYSLRLQDRRDRLIARAVAEYEKQADAGLPFGEFLELNYGQQLQSLLRESGQAVLTEARQHTINELHALGLGEHVGWFSRLTSVPQLRAALEELKRQTPRDVRQRLSSISVQLGLLERAAMDIPVYESNGSADDAMNWTSNVKRDPVPSLFVSAGDQDLIVRKTVRIGGKTFGDPLKVFMTLRAFEQRLRKAEIAQRTLVGIPMSQTFLVAKASSNVDDIDEAVVKELAQLFGIQAVDFTVSGQPLRVLGLRSPLWNDQELLLSGAEVMIERLKNVQSRMLNSGATVIDFVDEPTDAELLIASKHRMITVFITAAAIGVVFLAAMAAVTLSRSNAEKTQDVLTNSVESLEFRSPQNKLPEDQAMHGPQPANPGGIDLNAEGLDLKVQERAGTGLDGEGAVHADLAGLKPEIISIRPLHSLPIENGNIN